MVNWMAQVGARLADEGYPVVPIAANAKFPGRWTAARGWEGYKDWPRHCDRPTKAFEVDIWRRWPGCGVGVAGGRVVGVDIDVLDPDVVEEIAARARAELGDTPAVRIGRAPKRLLVYRAAEPFASIKLHPLEILARGSQFVAYGTHPDTGEPYRWPADELAETMLASLPVVDEAACRRFLEAAYAMVPPGLRQNRLGPDRHAELYYVPGGDLRGTRDAIAAALEHVPNDDLHYDDWIRIGLALKGALGEGGGDLFASWSARSTKHGRSGKRDTVDRTWRSLRPERIGAGTIYGLAVERGWSPDPALILNGALAEAVALAPDPGAGLLAIARANGAAAPVPSPPPSGLPGPAAGDRGGARGEPVPEEVMTVGGLLGGLVGWMTGSAIYPQPFLALAAAIVAVGTAAGRRYAGPGDIRTNVYCVGIADSGSGKEHQINCLSNLFGAADLLEHFAGEEVSSGTAIESTMARRAVQLFQIDEIGHFLASVLNPRANSSHRRDILVKLTKYTGAANRLVKGTEYANKQDRERVDVHEPCVCLHGATVPEPLWRAFASGALNDGSVARMLFFQTPDNYPDWNAPSGSSREVPPGLVEGLRFVVAQDAATGDLGFKAAKGMALDGRAKPALIRVAYADAAAERRADELLTEQVRLKREHEGLGQAAVWARWYEHIVRLALVCAISRDPCSPSIATGDLAWARALVDHCVATLLVAVERHVADTEHEATAKRVLEIVRRYGRWMKGHELANRVRFIPRKARDELVAELVEAGLLEMRREETGKAGRPTFQVCIPGKGGD